MSIDLNMIELSETMDTYSFSGIEQKCGSIDFPEEPPVEDPSSGKFPVTVSKQLEMKVCASGSRSILYINKNQFR